MSSDPELDALLEESAPTPLADEPVMPKRGEPSTWLGALRRRNVLGDYGNQLFGGDPQADREALARHPVATGVAQGLGTAALGAINPLLMGGALAAQTLGEAGNDPNAGLGERVETSAKELTTDPIKALSLFAPFGGRAASRIGGRMLGASAKKASELAANKAALGGAKQAVSAAESRAQQALDALVRARQTAAAGKAGAAAAGETAAAQQAATKAQQDFIQRMASKRNMPGRQALEGAQREYQAAIRGTGSTRAAGERTAGFGEADILGREAEHAAAQQAAQRAATRAAELEKLTQVPASAGDNLEQGILEFLRGNMLKGGSRIAAGSAQGVNDVAGSLLKYGGAPAGAIYGELLGNDGSTVEEAGTENLTETNDLVKQLMEDQRSRNE